jgi:hypothetical protein
VGKYRAQFSLPNHLFGTIREYADDHPVVQHRVASGMLVRVDDEVAAKRVARGPAARHSLGVVDDGTEPGSEPVVSKAKQPARKRKAKAKPEPEVVADPEPEPEPEVEVEGSSEESPTVAPSAGSSVQTSWRISD